MLFDCEGVDSQITLIEPSLSRYQESHCFFCQDTPCVEFKPYDWLGRPCSP